MFGHSTASNPDELASETSPLIVDRPESYSSHEPAIFENLENDDPGYLSRAWSWCKSKASAGANFLKESIKETVTSTIKNVKEQPVKYGTIILLGPLVLSTNAVLSWLAALGVPTAQLPNITHIWPDVATDVRVISSFALIGSGYINLTLFGFLVLEFIDSLLTLKNDFKSSTLGKCIILGGSLLAFGAAVTAGELSLYTFTPLDLILAAVVASTNALFTFLSRQKSINVTGKNLLTLGSPERKLQNQYRLALKYINYKRLAEIEKMFHDNKEAVLFHLRLTNVPKDQWPEKVKAEFTTQEMLVLTTLTNRKLTKMIEEHSTVPVCREKSSFESATDYIKNGLLGAFALYGGAVGYYLYSILGFRGINDMAGFSGVDIANITTSAQKAAIGILGGIPSGITFFECTVVVPANIAATGLTMFYYPSTIPGTALTFICIGFASFGLVTVAESIVKDPSNYLGIQPGSAAEDVFVISVAVYTGIVNSRLLGRRTKLPPPASFSFNHFINYHDNVDVHRYDEKNEPLLIKGHDVEQPSAGSSANDNNSSAPLAGQLMPLQSDQIIEEAIPTQRVATQAHLSAEKLIRARARFFEQLTDPLAEASVQPQNTSDSGMHSTGLNSVN